MIRSKKYIYVDGVAGYWTPSKVKSILIDSKGGDDFISLDSLTNGGVKALKVAATIQCDASTDRVSVGAAFDAYFSGLGGEVYVDKYGRVQHDGVNFNLDNSPICDLENGELLITGTNGIDNLNLSQLGGKIYVVNGADILKAEKVSKVKSIVIRLQDGDETLSLDSLGNGGTEPLLAPMKIYSGEGSQVIRFANGHTVNLEGHGHALEVDIDGAATLDGEVLDENLFTPWRVDEGEALTLTFSMAPANSTPSQVLYSVTEGPSNGDVKLSGLKHNDVHPSRHQRWPGHIPAQRQRNHQRQLCRNCHWRTGFRFQFHGAY